MKYLLIIDCWLLVFSFRKGADETGKFNSRETQFLALPMLRKITIFRLGSAPSTSPRFCPLPSPPPPPPPPTVLSIITSREPAVTNWISTHSKRSPPPARRLQGNLPWWSRWARRAWWPSWSWMRSTWDGADSPGRSSYHPPLPARRVRESGALC